VPLKTQVRNRKKNKNDIWNEDYSFENSFLSGRKSQNVTSGKKVYARRNKIFNGYGRKNPNEAKVRSKHRRK
jgi:hypothetical protein